MASKIQLSDHFTYGRLLRFTGPTAAMMVFTSIYGIVDGLFVSNFAGTRPFAALNLIYPLVMMLGTFGTMMGTGGSAIVAKTLGEGDGARARGLFSFFVLCTLGFGIACGALGLAICRPVGVLLGAQGELLRLAVLYGSILCAFLPFMMLQQAFQSYLTAAGRPKVGLTVMVTAGIVNIALDALLIAGFGWGLAGAALATGIGEVVGGVVPAVYFASRGNTSLLRLSRPLVSWRALGKACVNGSSEMVSSLAMSLVGMLYNYQLMRLIGQDGVAAYGVIQYVAWIFMALFMGYAMGSAPLVSFHFGADNTAELKNLFRKSLVIIAVLGVVLTAAVQVLAGPLVRLFVGYDTAVTELTMEALSIYAWALLLCGFSIFGSSFFTALNNGVVSATISFVRTLVFETAAIMLLPFFLGTFGIWCAIIVAEAASVVLTTCFLVALHKRYGYA